MSWLSLDLANGPRCPHCGCRDARILEEPTEGTWWPSGRAACKHCGQRFNFRGAEEDREAMPALPEMIEREEAEELPAESPAYDPDRGVIYHVIRCPACGGTNTRVSRTARPIRYHKCSDCEHTFKSVEQS